MSEYPKMLYRAGDELIHGVLVSTKIVDDVDQEITALSDGWHATPGAVQEQAAPRRGRPPKICTEPLALAEKTQ